ncbi:hypothetical protein J5U23_00994 [Saccharolobus shibatae B12]|uniref:Uncharacterized protein n=1 Tax=Saccharolobus shibatae (strain ATCC 51178 / DSM 5389 / JCM 8931 / NBRC 15437 / B12) TaxID=523848 RepID=A0A8F5GSV2_SACSH|nr:hypothetical protein J5U23_00994 [Saccharolobus shibatae B12]
MINASLPDPKEILAIRYSKYDVEKETARVDFINVRLITVATYIG